MTKLKRNNKLEDKAVSFLKRNIKNNNHLYNMDESLNGVEFIVCPILKARMLRMQPSYITNILEMTIEEFDNKYPNFKKSCDRLSKKIREGLNEIDENGITKYQKSQINAHITRNTKNKFGITPNKQIGISTRRTHMKAIDDNGLNGYQRIAKEARKKQYNTMAKLNKAIDPNKRREWRLYRNFCIWLTRQGSFFKNNSHLLGKMGVTGAMQIDHRYSIYDGFKNKISPFLIANNLNLQLLSWEENRKKGIKSDIDIQYLYTKYDFDSFAEYQRIMFIIENSDVSSSVNLLILYNEIFKGNKKCQHI